jgi:regulator of cell morphogenesis and NO signaling
MLEVSKEALMANPETWSGDLAELDQCKTASLAELVRYLVEKYHREARIEMARLETQAEEAALLEGQAFPELLVIRAEVERFCLELRAHLKYEERVVFPSLLTLGEGRDGQVPSAVRDPLRLLQDEHVSAAGLLQGIHRLTEGFQPPAGARAIQRKLFQSFQLLAASLDRHIYLENQVLFKRVLHNQH